MDSKELKWQRRDIFDYTIYEKEEVRSEVLWYWHRTMYLALEDMQYALRSCASVEFHGRIASVHYVMYEGRFFLPCNDMEFAYLPKMTEKKLPLAIMAGLVYEMKGYNLEFIKRVLFDEPEPEPLLNNEYDFRKFIGTRIWRNSGGNQCQ